MKRALIVRHTSYEGAAGFRIPIEDAGYAFARVDVLDPAFDDIDFMAPDLLVLMGGPMGVYERADYPWIDHELDRIAARLAAGLPTIGICLGAQLIAAALGARVYPGAVKEIGFAPVTVTEAGMRTPVRHLLDTPLLHWHGDTFDLPDGCELLASTARYANQAYRRGDTVLALQCHPEMGEDPRIDRWIDAGGAEMAAAGTNEARIRAEYRTAGPAAVAAGRAMLTEWLAALNA